METMVSSIEQSIVPRYSAAGNGKERETKDRDGSSLLSSKESVKQELMG
jgi:hypothetical protein